MYNSSWLSAETANCCTPGVVTVRVLRPSMVVAALVSLLFYAIPQVMLQDKTPIDAIQSSIMESVRNWQPLGVFVLICLVLGFIAAIPIGLGFLILGPIAVGGWYQNYKELYEE